MTPAEKERAAVVAWLREQERIQRVGLEHWPSWVRAWWMVRRMSKLSIMPSAFSYAAASVERGDHLTGRP